VVSNITQREKCYVEVVLDISSDGLVTPLAIYWEDGRCFCVDRVLERRYAASMKVGGHGMRYAVEVEGKLRHLWNDERGWYVERIINDGITSL